MTDPSHGIVGVSIDGGNETGVDLFGIAAVNVLVFTSPLFCAGPHTLKARVTGTKNTAATDAYASIDRVQIDP